MDQNRIDARGASIARAATVAPAGADLPQGALTGEPVAHVEDPPLYKLAEKWASASYEEGAERNRIGATIASITKVSTAEIDARDAFIAALAARSGATAAAGVPDDEAIEDFLAARMTPEGRVPMLATIKAALEKWGAAPLTAQTETQPASEAVAITRERALEMGWHPRDLHIATPAQPAPAPGAGKGEKL